MKERKKESKKERKKEKEEVKDKKGSRSRRRNKDHGTDPIHSAHCTCSSRTNRRADSRCHTGSRTTPREAPSWDRRAADNDTTFNNYGTSVHGMHEWATLETNNNTQQQQ